MIQRLKALWELQQIDNELDQIEESRGDLPRDIKLSEDKYFELKSKIEEATNLKKQQTEQINKNHDEIVDLENNLKKYKSQLLQVKTNREYDALTKQIDFTKETIEIKKSEINNMEVFIKKCINDIEIAKPEMEKIEEELKIKKKELSKIDKETEYEKVQKEEQRKKIIAKINKTDYRLYDRIRQKHKKAVVAIKRNACDGCFATISSQKQLEIRRNDKVYNCETCGRILISQEISDPVK